MNDYATRTHRETDDDDVTHTHNNRHTDSAHYAYKTGKRVTHERTTHRYTNTKADADTLWHNVQRDIDKLVDRSRIARTLHVGMSKFKEEVMHMRMHVGENAALTGQKRYR